MPDAQRRATVVVVGSYAVGLVMRVAELPGRGETVLGRDFQQMDGGKGSNQAVACARLGARTAFIAAIGEDAYGDGALALLAREGVDTSHVRRVPGVATGAGFILVDDAGNNAIAVDLGANRLLSPADIDRAEELIAGADVLLVQLEIAVETALHALAVARRHGVRTILNPAPAQALPVEGLALADILTPNLSEGQVLLGRRERAAPDLGRALRAASGSTIVLTAGEEGAWIVDRGAERRVPAHAVHAVDTTGAGDAFSAALAVALAEGQTLDDAVRFGCAAGGFCVRSLGTVPSYATRDEIERFIREYRDHTAP